jgi:hypothetical protein
MATLVRERRPRDLELTLVLIVVSGSADAKNPGRRQLFSALIFESLLTVIVVSGFCSANSIDCRRLRHSALIFESLLSQSGLSAMMGSKRIFLTPIPRKVTKIPEMNPKVNQNPARTNCSGLKCPGKDSSEVFLAPLTPWMTFRARMAWIGKDLRKISIFKSVFDTKDFQSFNTGQFDGKIGRNFSCFLKLLISAGTVELLYKMHFWPSKYEQKNDIFLLDQHEL